MLSLNLSSLALICFYIRYKNFSGVKEEFGLKIRYANSVLDRTRWKMFVWELNEFPEIQKPSIFQAVIHEIKALS